MPYIFENNMEKRYVQSMVNKNSETHKQQQHKWIKIRNSIFFQQKGQNLYKRSIKNVFSKCG